MICLFFSPVKASVFFLLFLPFCLPESLPHNNTQHKGKAFRATTQQQQRAQTLCAIQSSAGRKKSERD
jgi:sugar (pentulose or hexulose) kinase